MKRESLKLVICGGDKRHKILYDLLRGDYPQTALFLHDGTYSDMPDSADVLILPTVAVNNGILNAPKFKGKIDVKNLLNSVEDCKTVIAGKLPNDIRTYAEKSGIRVLEYAETESFKIFNAIPTAEGAIALAVQNGDVTLWGSKIVVIGCGCIGKCLAERLWQLGANVTVTARKSTDKAYITAHSFGFCETASVATAAKTADYIFNTVPSRVLSSEDVAALPESTVYIELASKPYGIAFENNEKAKCKLIYGSGLPGKFSPNTAASIIKNEITRLIEEDDII